MKKSTLIFLIILALFVGSYTAYNIHLKNLSDVDTQYAVLSTAQSTVSADCFVIRDEYRGEGKGNKAIIKNSGDGVYIPYVEDGSRVAAGDIIALFFTSEENAKAYREEQLLKETLAYYEKLQNQSVLSTLDVDKLESTINDNINRFIKMCENGDYSESEELLSELKFDISAKKIATGEEADFSKEISSLNKQIKKLSKRGDSYKTIRAGFSGCFISKVDGYENSVDYGAVSSLTRSDFDKLLSSEAESVPATAIGKIIGEYNWYAVCNVPKEMLEKIALGKKVTVSFKNTDVSMLEMKVFSISPVSDGYATLVLVSNQMSADISLLRKEKIEIITDEFEGLKIPRTAVRNAESPESEDKADIAAGNGLGVYILYGQVIRFRTINVLYYDNDFIIAERETDNPDSLKLYDMIITKGRNLYDGKLIG